MFITLTSNVDAAMSESDRVYEIPLTKKSIIKIVSEFLTSKGFSVNIDFRVRGVSGFEHNFDIFAQRGELKLLIDVLESSIDIVSSLAKRVDIRDYQFLILAERSIVGIPREVESSRSSEMFESGLITYDDVRELCEKLERFLAERLA